MMFKSRDAKEQAAENNRLKDQREIKNLEEELARKKELNLKNQQEVDKLKEEMLESLNRQLAMKNKIAEHKGNNQPAGDFAKTNELEIKKQLEIKELKNKLAQKKKLEELENLKKKVELKSLMGQQPKQAATTHLFQNTSIANIRDAAQFIKKNMDIFKPLFTNNDKRREFVYWLTSVENTSNISMDVLQLILNLLKMIDNEVGDKIFGAAIRDFSNKKPSSLVDLLRDNPKLAKVLLDVQNKDEGMIELWRNHVQFSAIHQPGM